MGLLVAGCPSGSDLENPERWGGAGGSNGGGSACDAKPLLEERCGGSICHSPKDDGSPPSGVTDLTSPGVEGRLLDQPAAAYSVADDADACPTTPELLIDSANTEQSLLLLKVTDAHTCGEPMPTPYTASNQLTADEIACLRSWITGVAADGPSGSGGAGSGGSLGTGGDTGTGGTGGTGGDDGAGGTGGGAATAFTVEAECAHGPAIGDCMTYEGTQMGTTLEDTMTEVGYITGGDYLSYSDLDLTGITTITILYSKDPAAPAGTIELRLDAADGDSIGTFTPDATDGWTDYQEAEVTLVATTGVHDLFLVATGGDGICNLDSFELSP